MSSKVLTLRGRVAGLSRDRKENDPELVAARGELTTTVLAEHIRKVVATAPPLTAAQRDTIMAAFAGFTPTS